MKNKVSGGIQIILFTGDHNLCGVFPDRLKGGARGDGKEEFFLLFLPVTPRAPFEHASRDWGRVTLTGLANVRSGARSSTEVPIINGQTRKVEKIH